MTASALTPRTAPSAVEARDAARGGGRKVVEGVVNLVQENRFQLVTDTGEHKLFVLSHSAPIEGQDLPPLMRRQWRVRVEYTEAPDLIAGIAERIFVIEGNAS